MTAINIDQMEAENLLLLKVFTECNHGIASVA